MSIPTTTTKFESDLRVPPQTIIAPLAFCGVLIGFLSEFTETPFEAAILAMLLIAIASLAWAMAASKPVAASWVLVLATAAILFAMAAALDQPVALALLAIPTGLAAALISVPAAGTVAAALTLVLLFTPVALHTQTDTLTSALILTAIWATFGTLSAVLGHVHQLERWLDEYFQRSQVLVEESRDRRAELGQAVDNGMNLNRQLVRMNERLALLRTVAEDARRSKSAFVSRVSHELRTPLNMIIGLVRLIVESPEIYSAPLPADIAKDLRVVHTNAEHLLSLINDVLDLSQIEAGRGKLYRERADIGEIVKTAADAVRPLIDNKRLYLDIRVPDDLPLVDCDRTRIRQVVLNVLSNAARFTEEGGITIDVTRRDGRVAVSVQDTGPGIAPDEAIHLFEPFYQAGDFWRAKGGSGLGLSISQSFVKLHGGRIWLDSELGLGTTVSFELPISPLVPLDMHPTGPIREDWIWRERAFRTENAGLNENPPLPRVLLCGEDAAVIQELAGRTDTIEFIQVSELDMCSEATRQGPIQAAVLQTTTPDTLCTNLTRARESLPDTPIVGFCAPPRVDLMAQIGVAGYLVKPVVRERFEEVLAESEHPVRTILIVDDSSDVLQLWTRTLHTCRADLSILSAMNGPDALQLMRTHHPDLVLLDVVMPGMDGWEVLAHMNEDGTLRDIPVIMVSAQDPADEPPKCQMFCATIGDGLTLDQVIACTLGFSRAVMGTASP